MSTQRGRIQITGFDPEEVERRDSLSELDVPAEEQADVEGRWQRAWENFRGDRSAMLGLGIVVVMILIAIFSRPITAFGMQIQPIGLAPYDPATQHFGFLEAGTDAGRNVSPFERPFEHPMGTDGNARDLFSRILIGGRYSISIGFIVVLLTAGVGIIYGAISGYYGGWVDEVMMRFVDVIFAFPGLLLALVIVAVLGGGYWQLVLAFALPGWAGYARLIRGEILSVKENEYVMAAKALGARDSSVIFRHVVPNSIAPVIVQASLSIGTVVIGVAALGFLGVGFAAGTPEWGTILDQNLDSLQRGPGSSILWWQTFFPGAAIFLFVMAVNMIGDGINDALNAQSEDLVVGGGG